MNSKFDENEIAVLVSQVAAIAKSFHCDDTTGHDWWHVYRVWNLARQIAQREGANIMVVELAALLHDMDDHKIAGADSDSLPNARQTLKSIYASTELEEEVIGVIKQVSFKGAGVDTTPTSLEACVVQDADRLDAIGAIGIARAFAYGGSKNRELFNPDEQPNLHGSFHEYKNSKGSTLNHFYEKLLLLKDRVNTKTAKEIAADRHRLMEEFVANFLSEWNFSSLP